MNEERESIDLDGDGKVSNKEHKIYEEKLENQTKMAWLAIGALVCFSGYLMFFAPESRILAAKDGIFDFLWITLGSIVGAFFGLKAYMSKS